MDLYLRVRLACHVDGLSQREAASRFGIARETVRKMLRHSEPPGYRRRQPPKRPKLAPFTDIIDRILEEDRPVHRKQHHTAKRIFERLRDEHGFTGKETIVKDYVRDPEVTKGNGSHAEYETTSNTELQYKINLLERDLQAAAEKNRQQEESIGDLKDQRDRLRPAPPFVRAG